MIYTSFNPQQDFLQGIPMGIIFGTIPLMLRSLGDESISYAAVGIFSLASYPYSLKVLWSPIVDSIFLRGFGRRKTWIIPTQLLIGLGFVWSSYHVEDLLHPQNLNIYLLTAIFSSLIFLCATQDIAVDGWGLTLLDETRVRYSSACQTIGLNAGYFTSYTLFLALNSAEFCNRYIRTIPKTAGILQLGPFLRFWGFNFLIFTVILWIFVGEADEDGVESSKTITEAYSTMRGVLRLHNVQLLIVCLLFSQIGIAAYEAVFSLKLLEKGFPKEDLAITAVLNLPLQILLGILAASTTSGKRPLRPWFIASIVNIFVAAVGMYVIHAYPSDGTLSTAYFSLVIVLTIVESFVSTFAFSSMSSFFSTIADPKIGGTYLTLLNTLSNIASTWPRSFVLFAVDLFTQNQCSNRLNFCRDALERSSCKAGGGQCVIIKDGYYVVSMICIISGLLIYPIFIRKMLKKFESAPTESWRF